MNERISVQYLVIFVTLFRYVTCDLTYIIYDDGVTLTIMNDDVPTRYQVVWW